MSNGPELRGQPSRLPSWSVAIQPRSNIILSLITFQRRPSSDTLLKALLRPSACVCARSWAPSLSLQGAERYPAGRLKGQAGLLKSQKPKGAPVGFPLPPPAPPPITAELREDRTRATAGAMH